MTIRLVPTDTTPSDRQARAIAEINRLQSERAERILQKLNEAGADIAEYVACPIGKPGLVNEFRQFAPALARTISTTTAIGERS